MPGRQQYDPDGQISHEIFFVADLPAVSFSQRFKITPGSRQADIKKSKAETEITTNRGTFYLDGLTNLPKRFELQNGKTFDFKQEIKYYIGHRGNNSEFDFRASGAYIFRPLGNEPVPLDAPTDIVVQDGPFFVEIQVKGGQASQVLRIPYDSVEAKFDLEVEWMIGPIDISDGQGKEFINQINLDGFNNNGVFYTDANGRQTVKRIRNERPDYDICKIT